MVDIGTGDGRFVSVSAAQHPSTFYIGIDANVKPLEKPSIRATRKPGKGGLPNALFIQAAVEDMPADLDGLAGQVFIHFPWGSLLRSIMLAEPAVLAALRRLTAPGGALTVITGLDPDRDRSEIERLGIPTLTPEYLSGSLIPTYRHAGFRLVEHRQLEPSEWSRIETSWARRLSGSTARRGVYLRFQLTGKTRSDST
ncbi:MAG TPA: class I SAM-dependent methyltransferase [Pyrinomonadaceae bacterium]|nr:class I SAM-dependent methyltransferase [Pyrinomonadaceae bacterium]